METKERLCNFCIAIQKNSPVDAHVVPVPAIIPGYQDEIIMAAGTFVQGASIELSADGLAVNLAMYIFKEDLLLSTGVLQLCQLQKW